MLDQVKVKFPTETETDDEDKEASLQQKKEWMVNFLKKEGFEFSYGLFLRYHSPKDDLSSFQKNFLGFILGILRVFVTAALMSQEPQVAGVIELVRKQSSAQEEENPTEASGEPDLYDDQIHMIGDFSDEEPELAKQDSVKSQKEKDSGSKSKQIEQLSSQLQGDIAEQLIQAVDFNQLQNIILSTTASLLEKQGDLTFNEKMIVENALSLWLGCILHNPEIIPEFYAFKSENISNASSFLLAGITLAGQKKIREEFQNTFFAFATQCKSMSTSPYEFTLNSLLSQIPREETAGCQTSEN